MSEAPTTITLKELHTFFRARIDALQEAADKWQARGVDDMSAELTAKADAYAQMGVALNHYADGVSVSDLAAYFGAFNE